jgi:2-methylcitrate dehydratase PrpD
MNSLTAEVSEFISGTKLGEVPAPVLAAAKRSILDGVGLALAGSRTEVSNLAREEVRSYGTSVTDATVLGTKDRFPARFAAFLNGIAIHADDYDDTQLAVASDRVYGLLTHPTAPALGATLALAERSGASGAQLLLAYLLAVEVETKVAEAIDPRHYSDGFHSTGTAGTIGAGAGAARLLSLDSARTRTALGIAATQAAGLRENFGTMTKPFHAGRAAEGGVLAAQLAAAGMSAADNILEAKRGFFAAAGGGFALDKISGQLGRPWTFELPGVSIKPYPSGSLTHPAMTAMMTLIRQHDIKATEVTGVSVGTNRHMPNALIYPRPQTDLEAKFSMQFCMAILLIERRAGLAEFTDEVVRRPDVQALLAKVRFEVDPEAERAGYDNMASIVRVELADGRLLEERCSYAKGNPHNQMTDDELIGKFSECVAAGGGDTGRIADAVSRLLDLEEQPSLEPILAAMTPAR